MSSIRVPSTRERQALDLYLGGLPMSSIHLYTNDHEPGDDDSLGDYTEVAEAWYAQRSMSNRQPALTDPVSMRSYTTWDVVNWNRSGVAGALTVYGYFTKNTLGDLSWSQRFAAPFVFNADNPVLVLHPKLQLWS